MTARTKELEKMVLHNSFVDVAVEVCFAMRIGKMTKHMVEQAISKITVLPDSPTMDK